MICPKKCSRKRGLSVEQIEGMSVKKLAEQFGTPLYAYSESRILENLSTLKNAFESQFKSFSLHYAVKANGNLSILKLLHENGAGADCASPGEIALALKAGFEPGRIMYTGNTESFADLEAAFRAGVTINLDDLASFERLKRIGLPKVLSFRVNPGVGKGAFAQIVTGGEESKFGIPHEKAIQAYQAAQAAGVKRFGIHAHVGSSILNPADFPEIVDRILEIAGDIFKKLGVQPEFIDIGGGFGIPYRDEEVPLDMKKTAEGLARVFQAGVQKHQLGNPKLMVEPGRYLVANAGWLLAQVVTIKQSYRTFIGLDAGMQALVRPSLYGAFHRITFTGEKGPLKKVSVCGQTCESTDVFYQDIDLPLPQEGEIAVFHDAGAYGFSMASSYNGRPRPAEVLVRGSQARVIRRRETFEDLMALF